jgi:hypothetical protein
MPYRELVYWVAFLELRADERKKAYEDAAHKRGKR